jgi:predicted SnoaL-like aldol condensation-catalyzing enzyme
MSALCHFIVAATVIAAITPAAAQGLTETKAREIIAPWYSLFNVTADIVRMEQGRLAEHWDVLQNEATRAESKSGLPMFGDAFPS